MHGDESFDAYPPMHAERFVLAHQIGSDQRLVVYGGDGFQTCCEHALTCPAAATLARFGMHSAPAGWERSVIAHSVFPRYDRALGSRDTPAAKDGTTNLEGCDCRVCERVSIQVSGWAHSPRVTIGVPGILPDRARIRPRGRQRAMAVFFHPVANSGRANGCAGCFRRGRGTRPHGGLRWLRCRPRS